MSNDPYTPPSAPVRDRDPEATGSSWKAVSFGVLADFAGTFVGGTVVYSLLGTMVASDQSAPERLDEALMQSSGYLAISLAVGMCFTILGGFVAARSANRREYWHAFWTGLVVLVLGEVLIGSTPETYPLSYRIIGDLLTIPAALLGGHIRLFTRGRA
jgi:hypothetical protein